VDICWCEQQFRALEQQRNLEEKTVMELRDMNLWDFEVAFSFFILRHI
jgi:hypothetical protein